MLYGRQAIQQERRGEAQLRIGYVIWVKRGLTNFRLLSTSSVKHTNCLGVIWSSLTGN
jgi:hypothetical protein